MSFNFYSNIMEGGSDFAKSNYIEGGKNAKGENVLTKDEAKILLNITNHDFFTTFIFQSYFLFKKENTPQEDIIKHLKTIHTYLKEYNKTSTVFPLKFFNKDNVFEMLKKNQDIEPSIYDIITFFHNRTLIINKFKKLPDTAFKNNIDKSIPLSLLDSEIYLEKIDNFVKLYEAKKKELREETFSKTEKTAFSSDRNLEYWIKLFKETKDVKYERKTLETLVETLKNTETIFDTENYTLLKIDTYKDLSKITCNPNWCISRDKEHWDEYKVEFIYLLIDWRKEDDDYMYIIGKPFLTKNFKITFVDYGGEGFFNIKNKKLSQKELEEVWTPFQDELSSNDLLRLEKLENIVFNYTDKETIKTIMKKSYIIDYNNFFMIMIYSKDELNKALKLIGFKNTKNIPSNIEYPISIVINWKDYVEDMKGVFIILRPFFNKISQSIEISLRNSIWNVIDINCENLTEQKLEYEWARLSNDLDANQYKFISNDTTLFFTPDMNLETFKKRQNNVEILSKNDFLTINGDLYIDKALYNTYKHIYRTIEKINGDLIIIGSEEKEDVDYSFTNLYNTFTKLSGNLIFIKFKTISNIDIRNIIIYGSIMFKDEVNVESITMTSNLPKTNVIFEDVPKDFKALKSIMNDKSIKKANIQLIEKYSENLVTDMTVDKNNRLIINDDLEISENIQLDFISEIKGNLTIKNSCFIKDIIINGDVKIDYYDKTFGKNITINGNLIIKAMSKRSFDFDRNISYISGKITAPNY